MAAFPNSISAPKIPALSRRTVMRGLAPGIAGASVPVAAIAGLTARQLTTEDPELIQLAEQLHQADGAYLSALRTETEIVEEWYHQWPVAPEEIIRDWAPGDRERDLIGRGMKRADGAVLYVFTAGELRRNLRFIKIKRRRSDFRRRIALAKVYEAEKARVKTASGYEAAHAHHNSAANSLKLVVQAIMLRPGASLAETTLKARSLVAFGHLEAIHQWLPVEAHTWGPTIAAAMLAHLDPSRLAATQAA